MTEHTHTQQKQNRIKIATCQTCNFPIYRGDKVHYSTTGTRVGVYHYGVSRGTSHYDRWVQCQGCLSEYSKEVIQHTKGEEGWSKKVKGPVFLGLSTLIFLGGYFGSRQIQSKKPIELMKFLVIVFLIDAFLWGIFFGPIFFWLLKFVGIAKEPFFCRYLFRSYRPYFITENCYYCDKFCKKTKGSIGIGENDKEMGKITNNEFKTICPVCQPCGKERRKDGKK